MLIAQKYVNKKIKNTIKWNLGQEALKENSLKTEI